jgi:hypothetical protein
MPTPRQYATAQYINSITDIDVSLLTDRLIHKAETDIDNYIADFYQGINVKLLQDNPVFAATIAGNVITLVGSSQSLNYYQFTQARLSTGQILPVLSSTNNLLTIPATADLPSNCVVQISQLGKFPRIIDQFLGNKFIIQDIQSAVAYQVAFLIENSKAVSGVKTGINTKLNSKAKQSESIGENYSYDGGSIVAGGAGDTLAERISPLARDLIDGLGLSYQSSC